MRALMSSSVTKSMMNNSGEEQIELRRGPWTLEEDTLLTHYITRHGEGRWNMLAKCAGLKRTGKSCRLRWLNYLKPDIKRGNLTPQEQILILELHSKWGNRWSKIALHLPGRTDNEIKNYWRTRVQKQARQLNIEANSKRFLDAVRCYWMPRLVQKVEQASYSSSSPSSSSFTTTFPDSQPHETASISSNLSGGLCPPESKWTQCGKVSVENSSSVTSPCVTSTDSMTMTKLQPEILGNPTFSPILGDSFCNNFIPCNTHCEENSCYDIGGLVSMAEMGTFDNASFECQMAEGNWVSDTLWNMDDMWQSRDLSDIGI